MASSDEEILMYELNMVLAEAPSNTAQSIIDEIHEVSSRLNYLLALITTRKPKVIMEAGTDYEGIYMQREYRRLKGCLLLLNKQFMSLHNQQVDIAALHASPNSGQPPE